MCSQKLGNGSVYIVMVSEYVFAWQRETEKAEKERAYLMPS